MRNKNWEEVRSLLSGRSTPTNGFVEWDGRNDQGEMVASGVHLIQAIAGDQSVVEKFVVIK